MATINDDICDPAWYQEKVSHHYRLKLTDRGIEASYPLFCASLPVNLGSPI
ncbi:MAG: hypothetical protein HY739_01935 [Desulfobacterales bacterium]|nr:hypothetical protein [Desulfobacterales bacterium]